MKYLTDLSLSSDEALFCRTERHDTEFMGDINIVMDRRNKYIVEFERVFKCRRCGFVTKKTVNASDWSVTKRGTDYPDNYLVKGQGRIHVADAYQEQFSRRGLAPRRRK